MKHRITVRPIREKWRSGKRRNKIIMAKYHVVEIFESINGEGMRAGELAVFVRMKDCNLHCSYCDTAWACEKEAPFTLMSEDEICRRILESGIKNVTLTGGEPLLHPDIAVLLQRLTAEETLRLEIETNGSIDVAPYRKLKNPPVFTLDYKLPGSGMEDQMCLENFCSVTTQDTIKFVVSDDRDLTRAREMIEEYELPERCHVIFSAVFDRISPQEIVAFMRKHCLNDVRLQLQMHKLIWDPEQRGV